MPIRVLLVDSDPRFLKFLTIFLRQQNDLVLVGASEDGQEGLALAQHLKPEVVVTDLGTPGLAGLDLVAQLREALPTVGVVATCLLGMVAYQEIALAQGADVVVAKSRLITGLLPAIRSANRVRLRSGPTLEARGGEIRAMEEE